MIPLRGRNGGGPHRAGRPPGDAGVVSLEYVLILPVVVATVATMLVLIGYARDLLLLHEAARAGVRVAVTTTGTAPVQRAVRQAVPEIPVSVYVDPAHRSDGTLVTVTVKHFRDLGPIRHPLTVTAVGRVEPAVGRRDQAGGFP